MIRFFKSVISIVLICVIVCSLTAIAEEENYQSIADMIEALPNKGYVYVTTSYGSSYLFKLPTEDQDEYERDISFTDTDGI